MMNLIYIIASAIATQEGFYSLNSVASRNHNPGNLRDAPWLGNTRPKDKNGFVTFASESEGVAGMYHQIALDIARGDTLRQLISKWAPPSENDTGNYLEETIRRTSLQPDVPLKNYLEIDRIP